MGLALSLAQSWCSLQTRYTCTAFPGTHPCLFVKQGVVLPPQNACLIPQKDKGMLSTCQSPVSNPQLQQEHVAFTCSTGEVRATRPSWGPGLFRDLQPSPMAECPGPKSCRQPCDWWEGKNPVPSGPHQHTSFQLLGPGNKQLYSQQKLNFVPK